MIKQKSEAEEDGVLSVTTRTAKPQQEQTQAQPAPAEPLGPIVLRLPPDVQLTDGLLAELSSLNDALRMERNSQGELEILPPANIATSRKNSRLTARVDVWAENDGTGEAFDSSAGFTLPNGSVRSPDASWVLRDRLAELTDEQKQRGFPPISPDFVIELRSPSDSLPAVLRKMEEYMGSGVRLGWLIDSLDQQRRVYIYRPGSEVEILEGPESLSGEPELPGFTLDLKFVWEPGF